jgi:hypothetical protein
MERYEVTLKVVVNGNSTYVKTIIVAGSAYQAQQLALAQCGTGEIVFGPCLCS